MKLLIEHRLPIEYTVDALPLHICDLLVLATYDINDIDDEVFKHLVKHLDPQFTSSFVVDLLFLLFESIANRIEGINSSRKRSSSRGAADR